MQDTKKFNPADHLIVLKGKQYLEVKFRLCWFKQEYLDKGWSIHTELVRGDDEGALFKASALDDKGTVRATGYGHVTKAMFPRPVEKAETAAIGRCLAILGLGTQFAQELDEDAANGELADAPVAKPAPRSYDPGGHPGSRPAPKSLAPTPVRKTDDEEIRVEDIPF